MEIYTGKPEMVIFVDASVISDKKTFINVQHLVDNALRILEKGPEAPVFGKNQLLKLANGMGMSSRTMKVKVGQMQAHSNLILITSLSVRPENDKRGYCRVLGVLHLSYR